MNIETVAASKRAELFGMLDHHAVRMCGGRGLVIADSTLEDAGVLLDNLEPGTDFLFVDSGLDFEVTLQCALSGGYSALHFLGHGHEGAITLGGRVLAVEDFTALSSGEHADSPSFHFWSCMTGCGVKGRAFVDGIAQAFGSTVTAFSGLVGAGERGGSWVPDVLSREDGNTVVPFVHALAYQHTLVVVPAALQLKSAVTATGIDVQVWLKAGYSFDTFTLVMNYGTANATYTGAVTSSALAGWIVQPSLVSPGNLEIAGMNLTKFTSTSDVLLETISFTTPPGASSFTTSLVTGTSLEDSMLPVPSLPLGTLPVIDYGFMVDNDIVDLAENHTATDIIGADADAVDVDGGPVTFSLLNVPTNGGGNALFSIDASTGQISLTAAGAAAIDYESVTKSYALTVQATDSVTWVDQRSITLNVSNVNDNAPIFTSGGTGSVEENAVTTTAIYTATTTDADNLPRTYTLDGKDALSLNITSDGVVTLKASADYEAQKSYSFNVIAHDGEVTHDATQAVVVSVNNLNDNAPVFTSGGTGSVDENAPITTVVYTAVTTDADNLLDRTYTLGGLDATFLDITSDGVVTLKASADYETKNSYSFIVIADDGDNTTPQAVDVSVNKVVGPTVAITSNTSAVKIGETATITFTFSEDPGISFAAGDITTSNGALGSLGGSGLTRTALFTPTPALASGSASITVADASYTNAAGVPGSAGTTPAISIDTLAPSVLISSDKSAVKIGETATITFTFSEDPGASFVDGDIMTTGGTLGGTFGVLTVGGVTRTAIFTPTPGLASGSASITVANASYTDPAGNTGSAGTTPAISIDTLAPTLSITSDKSAVKSGEAATITFTFSEAPGTSFDAVDITTTGGSLGALSGSGLTRTALFTPTEGVASGSASITVANASYSDAAGNTGSAGATPAISIDTLAPTLSITSDKGAVKSSETATITFTFSEAPGPSFVASDITTTGGTLGALSGSGTTYTAIFTPTAGVAAGNASITVANASYTDAAGNNGSAGTTPLISIDTLAPTLSITSDKGAVKSGETATITFTFSEAPGASFVDGDIATTGGTLGALSGSGTTYTALFTPTEGVASGNASITVASASYTDAAGNTGSAGTTPVISIDTLAPTLSITSDKGMIKSGETAMITFTFSEAPGASFDAGDITTSGGTLGTLIGSGLTRTALFTPTAGIVASASITVADSSYADGAGNNGSAGTTPALNINTVGPTVAITSDTSALKIGETAEITFTFSKDTGTSFIDADITTTGGTLGALSGSGTTYTALFTPTAGLASGSASITVADSSYTDPDGNAGSAGMTPSVSIDTLAPTVSITSNKSAVKSGETAEITFTFSENPGTSFVDGDIATVNGTLGALTGSGLTRTAIFTPTPGLFSGSASITVADLSYTDAAGNNGSAGITPAITISTVGPTVAITSNTSALKIGETAEITFTFSKDPGSSFADADITTVGGTLGALSGSGITRTALFIPTAGLASGNASITVADSSYTDPDGNTGSVGTTPVITIDTLAPTVAITSNTDLVKIGETAAITFTFSEDPGISFVAGDITTVGGTLGALSGSGITRTALFTPTVGLASASASITLVDASYTDAAGNTGSTSMTPSIGIDTLAPTLSITSSVSEVKSGETATITFTFSENPGTSFVAADITTTGGTLGALSGSGLIRTALFTPTEGVASGSASITVANGSYLDPAGNSGTAGVTPTIMINTAEGAPITISGLALSADTGASATDFITSVVAQTISATLSAPLGSGELLYGSVDNGTTWTNITGKVTGTAISWDGATLSGSSTIQLEVRDAVSSVGTPVHHAYQLDMMAPTVVSITPVDHSTGVGVSETIQLAFSEDIQKGLGAIEIHRDSAAGPLVATYDAATSLNLAISGRTLTINPTDDLANETHYYVTFAAGTLRDLAGNSYSGTATAYDFVTELSLLPIIRNGVSVMPEHYTGSATAAGRAPIHFEFVGDSTSEVLFGTADNDFISAGGGMDAIDGGAGNDVLDGGTGSSFMTGGTGIDIFFIDGRGGEITWSTITDWQAGEQLALWGWNPGTSTIIAWVQDGAEGYKGLTMHADLNGDGTIDTSVTFTGIASQAQLPAPLEFDGLLWFT
jgi:methionine-rich copper-binding protein CopC